MTMMTRQQRRAQARAQAKKEQQQHKVYIGKSKREPERACPVCHSRLDASFCYNNYGFVNRPMRVGDLTVCGYCRAFLQLQGDNTFRVAGEDEFNDLPEILQEVTAKFFEDEHWPKSKAKIQ